MDDLTRRNFGPNADPRLVDSVAAKALATDPGTVIDVLVSKMHNEPTLLETLSEIAAPVSAINPDFKPNDESSFSSHGVQLRVMANVGHFVMMEDPDMFNDELADILKQLDATRT